MTSDLAPLRNDYVCSSADSRLGLKNPGDLRDR